MARPGEFFPEAGDIRRGHFGQGGVQDAVAFLRQLRERRIVGLSWLAIRAAEHFVDEAGKPVRCSSPSSFRRDRGQNGDVVAVRCGSWRRIDGENERRPLFNRGPEKFMSLTRIAEPYEVDAHDIEERMIFNRRRGGVEFGGGYSGAAGPREPPIAGDGGAIRAT